MLVLKTVVIDQQPLTDIELISFIFFHANGIGHRYCATTSLTRQLTENYTNKHAPPPPINVNTT